MQRASDREVRWAMGSRGHSSMLLRAGEAPNGRAVTRSEAITPLATRLVASGRLSARTPKTNPTSTQLHTILSGVLTRATGRFLNGRESRLTAGGWAWVRCLELLQNCDVPM